MNNVKPLVWSRIDATQTEGIWCERTDAYIKDAVSFCSTLVADYVIRKDNDTGKYSTNYGGRHENTYNTIKEAEHWAENTHYASKMQPYIKPDSITDIRNWFKAAKPEPTDNDRLTQIGCHFEEVNEMIDSILPPSSASKYRSANDLALEYKKSNGNTEVAKTYFRECIHPTDLLDAICDQIVTATGVAYMMGFDIEGALKEVIRSNNSKMVNGKFEFDENGKIMKPKGYSKPDLTPFTKDNNDDE